MNKDHIALIKHTCNYLAAVIANRALSFISIPVMTYLLSVEDYGTINVYTSTAQLCAIILTLNTEVAISRYYYDAKNEEDFKRFVGSSIRLSLFVVLISTTCFLIFSDNIANYLGFEKLLLLCILPSSIYTFIDNVFQQIYQPQLQSRRIAVISSMSAYLGFAMSVILILLMSEKKYYGAVFGGLVVQFLIGTYMVSQILKYTTSCFNYKHVKYILSFTLPYLPYSLSSIIIAQFGKMIIGQEEGFNSAGLYSFAHNLAGLMMVVIMVIHSAWNPYHMRYMNEKNYKQIETDYDIIWKVTLIFGAFLSLFGYEIGTILARPQYLSALNLIPILVVGYIFYQWSFVYLRNSGYVKKTIWNAIAVVSSGVVNIVLNSLLIERYQLVGVAVSFTISYAFMLVISWLANKFVLKAYVPVIGKFIWPFLMYLIVVGLSSYYFTSAGLSFSIILSKLTIICGFSLILMYKYFNLKLWALLDK